jgi:aspartate/methionine/tyrosine aminotransferase
MEKVSNQGSSGSYDDIVTRHDVEVMGHIHPADRVDSIEEYYFSTKLKEVAAMNVAGKQVINLGVGSPDMPPSKEAVDIFCDEIRKDDVHGYQPYTGIPIMRDGYARWYRQWYGVTLNPDTEILPLIGSKEGILHVSMAFLNPGDGVLIPNPGYPTYASVSKLLGADIVTYTLDTEKGWFPDFEELERLLKDRQAAGRSPVKLMWVNYPNMPTGADANIELFEKLVDFGFAHGLIICNDNPYSFILNEKPQSIMQVPEAKNICIELNSMSKSHNMPGWRMAMLTSNEQFVRWILKVKSNVDSGQFRPMQSAVIEALKADRRWYDSINDEYKSRRVLVGQIMDAIDCTYDRRQVGLFVWGRIPERSNGCKEFTDKLLYEAGVFIAPGFIFGSAGERYVRISLCCKSQQLEAALARVQHLNF